MRQEQTWPGDIDPGEFLSICREVVAAVADYHADLSGRDVVPDFTPEEVRAQLAGGPPGEGESAGALPADWRERVMPVLTASAGLSELLSKNFGLLGHLHGLVSEHPDFEVLHEPAPYLYRFRYVPNRLAERQEEPAVRALLDRLNQEVVEAVRRGGPALLTTTRVRGRVALRVSACSHRTSLGEIETTFEAVARWGRLLNTKYSDRYERPSEMEAQLCSNESHSSPTEVSAT